MNTDKATSIFWLFISIIVSVASFRLGLGKLSTPGSGFMPFGAAVLLGVLSIVCFLQAMGREESTEAEPLFRGLLWPKVILVFVALFAYTQLIPFGGYSMTTFSLMAFLFWIAGQKKIWKVALYSLTTTVLSYYVFSKWLNLQFPIGPLGF
jgi:putative tricarboxylic transport membrane protein